MTIKQNTYILKFIYMLKLIYKINILNNYNIFIKSKSKGFFKNFKFKNT